MSIFIYADNAATTKLDIDAFEAMKSYLINEYGNASQPYSFSREPKKALKEARRVIAECINCSPDEIYFTSGGTESDNWAVKGSAFSDVQKRTTITSQIEHHAILNACKSIEKMGYPVVYLNSDAKGTITPNELESVITDNTRLVSIMFANNEIGTIQPIKELVQVAHKHGAIFHTDAVQAIGHVKIDVKELGVDMLSASAHKFNGPKGVGFLYIKSDVEIGSLIDGGAQENGHRAGTENIASIVGMAVALKKNCEDLEQNHKHIIELENLLLAELKKTNIDFIKNGSDNHIPGNISLSFKGKSGEAILHRMDLKKIAISTGSACDSVNTQISHVLQSIELDEEYAKGTIRISLGKDNSSEEVKIIADELNKILT